MIGCDNPKPEEVPGFDFGKTEEGIYSNSFFKLEVPFNTEWVVQDKQQMNNLIETHKIEKLQTWQTPSGHQDDNG